MYEELIQRLRGSSESIEALADFVPLINCEALASLMNDAADAIEVLTKETTDDAEFMCSIIEDIRNYAAKNNMEPDDTLKTVANNILSLLEISTFNHCGQKEGE